MEVIRLIDDELPLSSRAALVLTCKKLNHNIGNGSWLLLTPKGPGKEERANFLKLLERDLCSERWLCDSCLSLHSKSIAYEALQQKQKVESKCPLYSRFTFDSRYTTLCAAQTHLVMQRHLRGGQFGLPINVLSLDHKDLTFSASIGPCVSEVQMRGKIIKDELYVKLSYVMYITKERAEYPFNLCWHLDTYNTSASPLKIDRWFAESFNCRREHLMNNDETLCENCRCSFTMCHWCALEYEFLMETVAGKNKFTIIAWAIIEEGKVRQNFYPYRSSFSRLEQIQYCHLGSLRKRFETYA